MSGPLEIVFHEVDRSPTLEEAIRERAAKLEKFADSITSCRVTVERPHRHHHQGSLYNVRVDVRVAGAELVASRNHADDHSHENVLVALSDAFAAARRQLQDYSSARKEVR
jgi:ribosome-associated translation inhibitor RaiA